MELSPTGKAAYQEQRFPDHPLVPTEICLYLFQFLDAPALANSASVCKTWKDLTTDDTIWRVLFHRHIDGQARPSISFRDQLRGHVAWKKGKSLKEIPNCFGLISNDVHLVKTKNGFLEQVFDGKAYPLFPFRTRFMQFWNHQLVALALECPTLISWTPQSQEYSLQRLGPLAPCLRRFSDKVNPEACSLPLYLSSRRSFTQEMLALDKGKAFYAHLKEGISIYSNSDLDPLGYTLSEDQQILLVAYLGGKIKAWDLKNGVQLVDHRDAFFREIVDLAICQEKIFTIYMEEESTKRTFFLSIYDISTNQIIREFKAVIYFFIFKDSLVYGTSNGNVFTLHLSDLNADPISLNQGNTSDILYHQVKQAILFNENLIINSESINLVYSISEKKLTLSETKQTTDFNLFSTNSYHFIGRYFIFASSDEVEVIHLKSFKKANFTSQGSLIAMRNLQGELLLTFKNSLWLTRDQELEEDSWMENIWSSEQCSIRACFVHRGQPLYITDRGDVFLIDRERNIEHLASLNTLFQQIFLTDHYLICMNSLSFTNSTQFNIYEINDHHCLNLYSEVILDPTHTSNLAYEPSLTEIQRLHTLFAFRFTTILILSDVLTKKQIRLEHPIDELIQINDKFYAFHGGKLRYIITGIENIEKFDVYSVSYLERYYDKYYLCGLKNGKAISYDATTATQVMIEEPNLFNPTIGHGFKAYLSEVGNNCLVYLKKGEFIKLFCLKTGQTSKIGEEALVEYQSLGDSVFIFIFNRVVMCYDFKKNNKFLQIDDLNLIDSYQIRGALGETPNKIIFCYKKTSIDQVSCRYLDRSNGSSLKEFILTVNPDDLLADCYFLNQDRFTLILIKWREEFDNEFGYQAHIYDITNNRFLSCLEYYERQDYKFEIIFEDDQQITFFTGTRILNYHFLTNNSEPTEIGTEYKISYAGKNFVWSNGILSIGNIDSKTTEKISFPGFQHAQVYFLGGKFILLNNMCLYLLDTEDEKKQLHFIYQGCYQVEFDRCFLIATTQEGKKYYKIDKEPYEIKEELFLF
jgi:hypothetical protein